MQFCLIILFFFKVWSLYGSNRSLLHSFPGEHARNTFFRNIGMGVSHLYIDTCGRLFSCGADGSLKMRHLPTLECQPTNFFMPHSQSSASLIFGNSNNTVDNDHDQQQQRVSVQYNDRSVSFFFVCVIGDSCIIHFNNDDIYISLPVKKNIDSGNQLNDNQN